MGMTDKSLCDSCTNIGCEFQSGIVRTKCAFYMPPQLEPDNCGNYVVQDLTTKNDLGVDCISRIETIDYLCKHCPDDGECFKDCDEIKHLRQMPSVTPQEPNWIKCSEHLPDFDVDVLATTKKYGDVVKVTRWRTILKDCGWEWVLVDNIEGNAYNSDEIIAWMPLPEPYKSESEDKE